MGTFSTIASAASAAVLTLATAAAVGMPASSDRTIARYIVVAELFTSEGCSSCPPADALLQQIASQSPIDRVEVIGLEEHVDYWDRLGWRDPFSSATFTNRQSEYARVFRSGQIYTPQLVVDGSFEAVGSDKPAIRAAIAAAAARPAATVHVFATATNDQARVEIFVDIPAPLARKGIADVLVAIAEDGLVSRVQRGENGGRTLPHSAVVRSLSTIATIPPDASRRSVSVLLPRSQEWRTSHLRVVGFVQERESHRVLGAAATPLATQNDLFVRLGGLYVRSGLLKTTVLAAVAGTVGTQLPQVALRLRRLSLKCWFMGHDNWLRPTPDRLYLECFECGRETHGWATGKSHSSDRAGGVDNARVIQRQGHCSPASVCSPMKSPTRCERSRSHHRGDITLAA